MVLGPLDKRAIRTRCQACTHRKIKCQGGRPCTYCSKKSISCVEQAAKTQGLVIINQTPLRPAETVLPRQSQIPYPISGPIYSNDGSNQFIHHFFTTFITRNEFGVTLDLQTIISQFQSSPSLYHASIAIGALDLSRKSCQLDASFMALRSYRNSVINFQSEMQTTGFLRSDDGLWTTLFLGLFELMYDMSGEGWVKHILYGTSKILQLRGPEAHLTGKGRSFFLAVRVFELSRSLIYSEPSFLHQHAWKTIMGSMWEGNLIGEWHPKEALFDLMLECSELSQRVWDFIDPDSTHTEEERHHGLLETAAAGLIIRKSLDMWQSNFRTWEAQVFSTPTDSRSTLAKTYYHAISIYLSGLFDYHSEFDYISNPTIPFDFIQSHVHGILSATLEALESTRLAGLLFFFPLRVAGARAVSLEQKTKIIGLLKEISRRSFVVADAFVTDLEDLWGV